MPVCFLRLGGGERVGQMAWLQLMDKVGQGQQ